MINKPVVLRFWIKLEFENVLEGRGKLEKPEKKLLEKGQEPMTKLNPQIMKQSPGIKPGPHCWEASALTTVPSPLSSTLSTLFRTFLLFVGMQGSGNFILHDTFSSSTKLLPNCQTKITPKRRKNYNTGILAQFQIHILCIHWTILYSEK